MKKKGTPEPMTAAEVVAELEDNPEYISEREQQEQKLRRQTEKWHRAEAPLVEELRAAGFEVDSAWDLVNTSDPYPAALPILLEHVARDYPDRVREGIARALAVRDTHSDWSTLAHLYRREPPGTDTKSGLAVALAAVVDDGNVDELISLARDRSHGESRVLLLRALARSNTPEARLALEDLIEDPVVGREARRYIEQRTRRRRG